MQQHELLARQQGIHQRCKQVRIAARKDVRADQVDDLVQFVIYVAGAVVAFGLILDWAEAVGDEEMETLVTRPVEEAVSTVQGLDRVESFSTEGRSRVALLFTWGTPLDTALNDVRAAVEACRESEDGATLPTTLNGRLPARMAAISRMAASSIAFSTAPQPPSTSDSPAPSSATRSGSAPTDRPTFPASRTGVSPSNRPSANPERGTWYSFSERVMSQARRFPTGWCRSTTARLPGPSTKLEVRILFIFPGAI